MEAGQQYVNQQVLGAKHTKHRQTMEAGQQYVNQQVLGAKHTKHTDDKSRLSSSKCWAWGLNILNIQTLEAGHHSMSTSKPVTAGGKNKDDGTRPPQHVNQQVLVVKHTDDGSRPP